MQISRHKTNMEKLWKLSDKFDHICPAHNGHMLDKSYIKDFIALDEQILSGEAKFMEDTAGFGFPPSSESKKMFDYLGELTRVQYLKASMVLKKLTSNNSAFMHAYKIGLIVYLYL